MSNVRAINEHIKLNPTLEDMVSKSYTVPEAPKDHLVLQCDMYKGRGQLRDTARIFSECIKNAQHLSPELREGIAGIDSALHDLARDVTRLSEWAERELADHG